MTTRTIALVSALTLAVAMPAVAGAQAVPRSRTAAVETPAYRAGVERGVQIGEDDARRNQRLDYANKPDYRSGDWGYRTNYGDRNRYRTEFRVGFEYGYRQGYERYRAGAGGYGNQGGYGGYPGGYGGYDDRYGNPGRGNGNGRGRGGPPPWAQGRGGWQRNDVAYRTGFEDGYEEGLKAGRDNKRFDPVGEGRYKDGDRGYNRNYGTRDQYRMQYRIAFREGYEHGFDDGRRYGNRNDPRYDDRYYQRGTNRPWWWPWS
jgi:hypothetical protein